MTTKFFAVAVYDVVQVYGGPEEGGWYYHDGELVDVVNIARDVIAASGQARAFNEGADIDQYGQGLTATVVTLGRTERENEDEACHLGPDELGAEVTRWDIPTSFNRRRPHYC